MSDATKNATKREKREKKKTIRTFMAGLERQTSLQVGEFSLELYKGYKSINGLTYSAVEVVMSSIVSTKPITNLSDLSDEFSKLVKLLELWTESYKFDILYFDIRGFDSPEYTYLRYILSNMQYEVDYTMLAGLNLYYKIVTTDNC